MSIAAFKVNGGHGAFVLFLPLFVVLFVFSSFLFLFAIGTLLLRRRERRRRSAHDFNGPIDVTRDDLIEGDGGFAGLEERWLESVDESTQQTYNRAKEYQVHYPPNSSPTDVTLSQFLSIQEKGVAAWSFEPDYESMTSLLVHSRTELTFLPDPSSSTCVQSNLPLPKMNEVYYWEVKLFDLPETTSIAVGLATKPYPPFQLPGYGRYSVAYHSNGDRSFNYPFTARRFGPTLKEGDVLGVGFRPRGGEVFFTRNGRKLDNAFVGLTRWNLFPTIGANGPCSLHVNFGLAGFVFIEANVKKWGLAPSVGTLAPPPAYGTEHGSILLAAGGARSPDFRSQPPPEFRSQPPTPVAPAERTWQTPVIPEAIPQSPPYESSYPSTSLSQPPPARYNDSLRSTSPAPSHTSHDSHSALITDEEGS